MNVISMRRPQLLGLLAVIVLASIVFYYSINRLLRNAQKVETTKPPNEIYFNVDSLHVGPRDVKPSMADLSPAWTLKPKFVYLSHPKVSDAAQKSGPKIPHIFHQVWDTHKIPIMYAKWMQTWLEKHPSWQHWIWTLEDVRSLISHHYPSYLTLYDSYEAPVFRADVMRYFVLHRYGGVYVDLDMESLRPLDSWTTSDYYCLVSEECYEHTFVVREEKSTNVMNGFIASSPGHPFLDRVIRSLDEAALRYFGDYMYATGPQFFNTVYQRYAAKQVGHTTKNSSIVTVLPPYYFLPTYDPSESDVISGKCFPTSMRSLPHQAQIVCRELGKRSFHNTIDPLAYADHHWVHAYMYDEGWKKSKVKSVFDIVPGIKSANVATNGFEL
jgi:hypothetical protein